MAAQATGRPSSRGSPPPPIDELEPPSWADLYATTRELTLRAQSGAADSVLNEIQVVLDLARAADAKRIVYQLLYVEALCNMQLGRNDECVAVCLDLTRELSDDPVDRGWLSSSASMRALVAIDREPGLPLPEVLEAAIQLYDSPPRGLAYIWAVNVLGVVYLALRLYELALTLYDQLAADKSVATYSVSALYRILNAQLAHLYWGLELDRTGAPDAPEHFEQAMALGEQARGHLPERDNHTWELVLAARKGLCLAYLGDPAAARKQLEPVMEPLARQEVDDAVVARLGLVRAHASSSSPVALAHAERAILSIGHTTDYALAMGAVWERARLHVEQPEAAAAADYARLLARTSWDDRSRLASTMESRITVETARRQEAREIERVLYDSATGLASRLSFLRQLERHLADDSQRGQDVCVGLLEVDAEGFDDTLEKIIATLQVELLARYDRRELAVIAIGIDGDELVARIEACGADVLDHLTGGVAALEAPTSATGLILHADEALLAARRNGGLRVNPHATRSNGSAVR